MIEIEQAQRIKRRNSPLRGQGLVEFALALTAFLIIAFGVMDLARVFHTIVTVTAAAREGARYYTRNPKDQSEAQGSGINLNYAQIAATCVDLNGNGQCDGGQPATVTVQHTFTTVMGNLFAASPLTITRSVQMMVP